METKMRKFAKIALGALMMVGAEWGRLRLAPAAGTSGAGV